MKSPRALMLQSVAKENIEKSSAEKSMNPAIPGQGHERVTHWQQKPAIIWFTGLSGAGKTTTANLLEQTLSRMGYGIYALDGDVIRRGLCKDLGFSDQDRVENIRRAGEVAKLMVDAGLIVLVSFISPFRKDREMVRNLVGKGVFVECFVDASLPTCERRDPKGLYKKARAGALKNFTGLDSPYEAPVNPELNLNTELNSPEELVDQMIRYLDEKGIIY
jgi:adenylyl-sulfate kinase